MWPLPADYWDDSSTEEYRRLSRINACRTRGTPEDTVHAFSFFRNHYLLPDPSDDFNPMFYDPPIKDLVQFHYEQIYRMASHRLNAMAFPRGGGKSMNLMSYLLFNLVAGIQWQGTLYVSKYNPFVKRWGTLLKEQIIENKRIVEDWGRLDPPQRTGGWSIDLLRLTNRSQLTLFSFDGRVRGARGHAFLDDIEQDPDNKSGVADPVEIERISDRVRRVIIPQLRENQSLAFQGTPVHERCLLVHILTCDDPEASNYDTQFRSVERGGHWHKMNLCNEQQAEEFFGKKHLQFMRETLGPSAYMAEFGGRPQSSKERVFSLDGPLHEYWIRDQDEWTYQDPWRSKATVHYQECSGSSQIQMTPTEKNWSDLVEGMSRCVVVDPKKSSTQSGDWAVVHVLGTDHRNDLWSLDLWAGREPAHVVADKMFETAIRWRVPIIGVEEGPFQVAFYEQASVKQAELLNQLGWVPQLMPLKPVPYLRKGERIRRLEWRFPWGKVKLPGHRSSDHPYRMLYDQITDFTEDLGNLHHDDAIDTLEMGQQVLSGRRGTPSYVETQETPMEMLMAGRTYIHGSPIAGYLNFGAMDVRDIDRIVGARQNAALQGTLEGAPGLDVDQGAGVYTNPDEDPDEPDGDGPGFYQDDLFTVDHDTEPDDV